MRSGLTHCVIARFICEAVSRVVSLRGFSCVAVSRIVSLRGFSCVAISRVVLLRDFSAEQFHVLCRCETFLRSGLTHCVIASFFYIPL